MIKLSHLYQNYDEAAELVRVSEKRFTDELSYIASEIASDRKIKCISLSGPSCSGKTTAAAKLTSMLNGYGIKSRVISVDDFYYDKTERIKYGITDIEGPESINFRMFKGVIDDLYNSKPTLFPTFDFQTQQRSCFTEYIPHDNDLYIFEGIQAIYPCVIEILSQLGYKRIFISVAEDADIIGNCFNKNEIRLIRRTVRDNRDRAVTPAETMKHWHKVRENEKINIYPNVIGSDFVINSLLEYELLLISRIYLNLTKDYKVSDPDSKVVISLRERLSNIKETAVDISLVPFDSVFREFIG